MAIKNKYSDIDLSKYSSGYTASKDVLNAQKLKTQAEEAVKNYGDFNYKNQAAYDDAMNAILNRKGFTYDVNGDALYQQYKDNYMRQGKLAMQDTMAQAASLTGGYGNSYATSVGNQAYQGYLAQLNDVIPELYNLALNAYNAEGDRLNTNYNLLATDRDAERAMYTDKYNQLVADRGYYSDNYNNAYTQDYSKWTDNRNYDTSQYWNEYNAGYQAERDAIADAQWQKQFNESVRQFNASRTGGTGNATLKTPTEKMYDEALEIYNEKGEAGLDAYFDKYPDYDISKLMAYVQDYGDMYDSKDLKDRTWTVTDDGGWNWFNGVDNNAVLTDHYGISYTAKDLKKKLIDQGYSEEKANDFLKKYGVYK